MSSLEYREWGRGRWALTIALIFAAQVALIFALKEPLRQTARKPEPKFHLLARPLTSSELAASFFASDPTLFSGASLHSFSGPAWLCIEPPNYAFPEDSKPTNWLALDVNKLGEIPEVQRGSFDLEPQDLALSQVNTFPALGIEQRVRTQSVVRIEGGLAARAEDAPSSLPEEPFSGVLTRSEILFAVNQAGLVCSTRLLGRSGSPEADRKALGVARRLRFAPAPAGSPPVVWGRLVVEWQCVSPTLPKPSTPDEDDL